jgi:Ca-activated chloride channel homolog
VGGRATGFRGALSRMRRLGRPALFVAGALALLPAPAAAALVDWLVLLVDASGSIDGYEYRLQHEAYVAVLRDPEITLLLEGAQVAIVEFAKTPQVIVDWSADPEQAASAYAAHARRVARPGPASTTGIARALRLALDMLEDKPGRKVIDISGDGADNVDWVAAVWFQRERARRMYIEINGLAIPTPEDPEVDRYYAENVINGFLEVSRQHVAFERTLRMKMQIEIAGNLQSGTAGARP